MKTNVEFTPKEAEIFRHVAYNPGHPVKRVAHEMNRSINTINEHMKSIYVKTGVHSKAELVSIASKIFK
jgi:DNA-binding CsgD family transcriptional regulator